MNIDNWRPYLKYHNGYLCMAQQTYEPLISPDGNVFCANYNWRNKYQRMYEERPLYTKEVCDYFFEQEVKYIEKFKNKSYAPEVIDVDETRKRIFIKWYNNSCNHTINNRTIDIKWLNQIKDIILDQYNEGFYKVTMYSHSHYIDNCGNMKAIDWYGTVPVGNPYIELKFIEAIVNDKKRYKTSKNSIINNKVNLESLFFENLNNYVFWGDFKLAYICKEMCNG